MNRNRRNGDSNVEHDLGGLDPTLMKVIRLEFAFELRCKELQKLVQGFDDTERQIRSLFDEAYALLQSGAPQVQIASVLKEIMTVARRSHFWRDRESEEKHKEGSSSH